MSPSDHAGLPAESVGAVTPPELADSPLDIPKRLLMGPGPSNAHPRVLQAQALPLLGHMHPPFIKIMDEIRAGLRYLFQTSSPATALISGTGHAGMEACIANLIEPGDTILIGNSGIWGDRVADMAARFGAVVQQVKPPSLGAAIPPADVIAAIEATKPAVVFLVQGESSTGVHQSLAGIGPAARAAGALLVVDTVASLGGVPFFGDAWQIDAAYSGSQKVLSAPPGAAPLFFGERALAKLKARKTKPISYQLDLNLVGNYWGWWPDQPRAYHHTGMVSMWYAMREALAIVASEGLPLLWARHAAMADRLWAGLRELGLEPYAADGDGLVTVNTIKVPAGVDWAAVCASALSTYHLEIAGGLGPSAGQVWRVGLMGANACPLAVDAVIAAFRSALQA